MNGNLLVGQSGGPTSVINASLAGVIAESFNSPAIDKVYGAVNGIDGVINENFYEFTKSIDLEALKTTPSAFLGSIRTRLPEDLNDPIYEKINNIFKNHNIKYFIYIGGNDSMDTCHKLATYFKNNHIDVFVNGVPKTIDNDLAYTDHAPGYGSACKYVASTLMEIYADTNVYKVGRVTIVEIMGRDAGWLTASAKLHNLNSEGADLIYLPEVPFDVDKFLQDVDTVFKKKQKVLVAVSEGIRDKDGNYILNLLNSKRSTDMFGHMQLGGVCIFLSNLVSKTLKYHSRPIELNLPQRCASHMASLTDVNEAFNCGSYGVKLCLEGYTNHMVIMKRVKDYEIEYDSIDLSNIANAVKPFPKEWIIGGNQISDDYLNYALPLIKGESSPKFIDGLPYHLQRK